jgi:polysaccharide export outer membrane protein
MNNIKTLNLPYFKLKNLIFVAATLLSLSSCISNKKIILIQKGKKDEVIKEFKNLTRFNHEEYLLKPFDVVDINIKTTSSGLNEILTIENQQQFRFTGNGLNSGDVFYMNGYNINSEGEVDLPLVGKIKIAGLNLEKAKRTIEERYLGIIKKENIYIRIKLGGFRYSALGEFKQPGKYTILQDKVTILEAIANAGDLTPFAKRNEIIILRQYPDGIRTFTVNILSDKIMETDFFYLHQNDIIYARPMNVKQFGAGNTFSQSLDIVLSLVTVVLLYLNVTK